MHSVTCSPDSSKCTPPSVLPSATCMSNACCSSDRISPKWRVLMPEAVDRVLEACADQGRLERMPVDELVSLFVV